jgi:glucose-1-phosphate adenylyltransferase
MRKTIGMIFAGGRVDDLSVLTERRPKSTVIFGGIYRTIDFALTNLSRSGIGQIGILTDYRPSSLMDHVGNGFAWDLVGPFREVRFLPPSLGPKGGVVYRGPAGALHQHTDFIERTDPDDILAISGDHVYSMNYGPLLAFHHENDADVTMAFAPVDGDASRFGIGELNAAGQILDFTEKPKVPRTNLASMSVYVFRREVLVEELLNAIDPKDGTTSFQIHEVVRRMMSHRRAYGFIFRKGWWYTRTLDEYYAFHRQLLGPTPAVDLASWGVCTNMDAHQAASPVPARFLPGSRVENSLIAPGCVVAGEVRNSVLSFGVRVEAGAVVTDSILWDQCVVDEGALVSQVISDRRALIGKRAQVGVGAVVPSEEVPRSLTCGATVLGMNIRVPAEARIGRCCVIHPETSEAELGSPLPSGRSAWPREEQGR